MPLIVFEYAFHANFRAACQRGAHLGFTVVNQTESRVAVTRFQRVAAADAAAAAGTAQRIVLSYDGRLEDTHVRICAYAYNELNPGMGRVDDWVSSSTSTLKTWACARLSCTYVPLMFVKHAAQRTLFPMRSMLGSTGQAVRGIVCVAWSRCVVYADTPSASLSLPSDASDVSLPPTFGADADAPAPDPALATLAARRDARGVPLGDALADSATYDAWLAAFRSMFLECACDTEESTQHAVDPRLDFARAGLRTKNNAQVKLEIGRVRGALFAHLVARRATDDDCMTSAQVTHVADRVARWSSLDDVTSASSTSLTPLQRLEWLNAFVSWPAQMRLYRLDAIDVCGASDDDAADFKDVRAAMLNEQRACASVVDWFQLTYGVRVPHLPVAMVSSADDDEPAECAEPIVRAENDTRHHAFSLGDHFTHDHEGRDWARMSNDCESLTADAVIMLRSLAPAHPLARIAAQYTFLYCVVAAYASYDSRRTTAEVRARDSLAAAQHPDPRSPDAVREAYARARATHTHTDGEVNRFIVASLSPTGCVGRDHADGASSAASSAAAENDDTVCHVVGVWVPRARWNAMRDLAGGFVVDGGATATTTTTNADAARAAIAAMRARDPATENATLPSGVCDASVVARACQFADAGASLADPPAYEAAYNAFARAMHTSARLFWRRTPTRATHDFAPYAHVVACYDVAETGTCTDYLLARMDARGNATYGVPLADLLRGTDADVFPLQCGHLARRTLEHWAPLLNLVPHAERLPVDVAAASSSSASSASTATSSPPTFIALIRETDYEAHASALHASFAALDPDVWVCKVADEPTYVYDSCRVREFTMTRRDSAT
jgi:hypothetical protein